MRTHPRQPIAILTCAGILWFAGQHAAVGHGDVHLQIKTVTQEILKSSKDPALYLRRSELYRQHRLYDPALADLEKARACSEDKASFDYAFGRLYLDAGWPESALSVLDRCLEASPDRADAHRLRGRALVLVDRPLEAVKAFSRAIELMKRPRPEHYIERARARAAAGPEHIEAAIAGLDEGISKLGPLVTLHLPAIDLELKRKTYDLALGRLDAIAAQSPRKETWLKQRGEILLAAGRREEAMTAFREAMAALDKLPPARRFVPAMMELEEALVRHLESKPGTPSPDP